VVNLKKQSQFVPAQMVAKSFVKGDYDNEPARGAEEKERIKANFKGPQQTKGHFGTVAAVARAGSMACLELFLR
jgi:hypothetical protein